MDGSDGSALSSALLHEIITNTTSLLSSSTSEAIITTTTATSEIFNTTPDDATYIAGRGRPKNGFLNHYDHIIFEEF